MTLTLSHGPLAHRPVAERNYSLDGPAHKLLLEPFPHRVRAQFAGVTVLDTTAGGLLHESAILPRLYVPIADIDPDVLEATDLTTHCPFKGDAAYHSVRVGDRVAENAVWHYPEPIASAEWLRGLASIEADAMDLWLDEDEEVLGHLRDPYHRVDARRSARHVRVTAAGVAVAETTRPVMVFETGLPVRAYVPREDVLGTLVASATTSVCPYKGVASWWSVRVGDDVLVDAAWSYEDPLGEMLAGRGHVCFEHDGISVDVGGGVTG